MFYAGEVPLWVEGVRVWQRREGGAATPVGSALVALGAWVVLFAAFWKRQRTLAMVAQASFVLASALAVAAVQGESPLEPLGGSWLLPPVLWIPALMLGGSVMVMAVRRFVVGANSLFLADALLDATATTALLWTLPRLDAYGLAATGAGVWAGKLLLAILILGRSKQGRTALAATTIAAYGFGSGIVWYHHYALTGDQPSYAVETASLARYGTINTWQLLQSGDYREFAPHITRQVLQNDTLTVNGVPGFPARDLGVSLFALPGYFLAGVDGARSAMQFTAAALAGILFVLLRRTDVRTGPATFAWAATCFSAPLMHFSSQLYPEMFGAALVTAGVMLLQTPLTVRTALILGVCMGLLPAFSARYWALALPLAIIGCQRIWQARQPRLFASLLLGPLVLVMTGMYINWRVYGVPLPNAGYYLVLHNANPMLYNASTPFAHNMLVGWAGIWLDRRWGLLATAPVLVLAIAGIPALLFRRRRLCLELLLVCTPYFVAVASTSFWHGGLNGLARYLVPIVPLLAVPLAVFVDRLWSATLLRMTALTLAVITGLTVLASLTSFDADTSTVRLTARCIDSFGVSLAALLPMVGDEGLASHWSAAAWLLGIAMLSVIGIMCDKTGHTAPSVTVTHDSKARSAEGR